jgi:NAD(P) transhydrogenase subunit alpha
MSQDQPQDLSEQSANLATLLERAREKAAELAVEAQQASTQASGAASDSGDFLIMGLSVFVLACFVGYYVVWRVTPALHSPLMGVTNAISSVIIVGALIALGTAEASTFSKMLGFVAVLLASVNIFGGFIVTRRMLHMFHKKG